MRNIDEYIRELLEQHECVVVPGFGAFLAHEKPASLDPARHFFRPPGKRISVNLSLQQNDGSLIHHIAESEQLTYEVVADRVRNFAEALAASLRKREPVHLPELGRFYFEKDHSKPFFEPEAKAVPSRSAFGLEGFHALPLAQEETPSIPVPLESQPSSQGVVRRTWKYAALGLIAFPVLGYVGWVTTQTELLRQPDAFALADLNPFTEKTCPPFKKRHHIPAIVEEPLTHQVLDAATASVDFTKGALEQPIWIAQLPEKQSVSKAAESQSTELSEERGRFHIVAGCFSEEANAKRLIRQLQEEGHGAYLIDKHRGLYRVSAGNAASRKEAGDQLKQLRQEVSPAVWLLIR